MASFAYVSSKLGPVNSATRSIALEVFNAARAAGYDVWFMWGYDPNSSNKEHHSKRALDFMVRNEAAGDFIRNYIWANRARLRLRHVIWEQHITSTVVKPGVRRKMSDRGNATQNHYDHVHAWFFEGSYQPPKSSPAPTKSSPAPTKPSGVRTLLRSASKRTLGDDVKRLQAGLKRVFPAYAGHLDVDGSYGPATEKAVKEFQRRVGIEVDGRVGPITRDRLKRHGITIYG